MELKADYLSHVNSMRDLYNHDKKNSKATFVEKEFEKIYKNVYVNNVNLKNAKEFISKLNNYELEVLKQYSHLDDAINPQSLSLEGAYNLLMHDFERYDFNDDGFEEVGHVIGLRDFTQDMDIDTKTAYIETMKQIDSYEERAKIFMALGFNQNELNERIRQKFDELSDDDLNELQNKRGYTYEQFIEDFLDQKVSHKIISSNDIKERIDEIVNSGNSSLYNDKEYLLAFKEKFNENTLRIQEEKLNKPSTSEILTAVINT